MTKLLLLVCVSLLLAYLSQHRLLVMKIGARHELDAALAGLIVMLSLFCGLRTSYNDTWTYIQEFQNAGTTAEFWASGPHLLGNPGYCWFESAFHQWVSPNFHVFLMATSVFTVTCFVRFTRRYTADFTFSILMFFTIGLYTFNMAAIKQCIAMAILTLAIPRLLKRKYLSFYLLVFLAMLFHTYALLFVILPVFTRRPWKALTYLTILAVAVILFTFESTITNFLELAENIGKNISAEEVLETESINVLRLAVYAVPPLCSFAFRKRLAVSLHTEQSLMINMSVLSFLIMCLGLASAANLFGRTAIYFELGTIVILPWMLRQIFNKRSALALTLLASVCYMAFYMVDITGFQAEYHAISLGELFRAFF